MSNALAIQVVTRGLIDFIQREVKRQHDDGGLPELTLDPTDLPPTEVKPSGKNHVNLFLYHLAPNAAFRNGPMPGRGKPGEIVPAPLALNLYYLITVYSVEAGEHAHHVLGRVMSALHLSSPLSRADLGKLIVGAGRAELSGLAEQMERIKITPVTLSPDEMSRLWSGFQTPYRLSVAYEASVVLIEATQPVVAPLPVLSRGRTDPDGFEADSGMTFPVLGAARFVFPPPPTTPVRQLDGGRLGDVLIIAGQNLVDAERELTLLFEHPRFAARPVLVPRDKITAKEVTFKIPEGEDAKWPAGIYVLRARLALPADRTFRTQTTNAISFALIPAIKPVVRDDLGASRVLFVPCVPRIRAGQQASLLLSDVELPLGTFTEDAKALWVWFGGPEPAVPDGEKLIDAVERIKKENARRGSAKYLIRLRVDGVDSLPFDPTTKALKYDEETFRVSLNP